MKICPQCESGYPDELITCPVHGGLLNEIRDLRPGMLVRNTYRIVRKLGKGGMSHVYLAQHTLLNEPQVLKFLSPDLSSDKDWASRFLREVRTLRQIRHKNVVSAGNLEPAEDGTLFFSMEYVEGPDLHEFYRQAPQPFDIGLALELVHDIAQGLGAAHALGVVHRDIKPENILVSIEGDAIVPKIADFGIVATSGGSRLTQSGNTMLTPQFAAPEQWTGKRTSDLDGRTDLYALGGLLFELLTGQSAFTADNYADWAQQHLHTPPPRPSELRHELKDWHGLDDLVLHLLAKDPNDRPADVAEVLSLMKAIEHVPSPPAPNPWLDGPVAAHWPKPVSLELSSSPAQETPNEEAPYEAAPIEFPPGSPIIEDRPRARRTTEPLKIWEPVQPRPAFKPSSRSTKRGSRMRTLLLVAGVLIALAAGARWFSMNEVNVRVLSNQKDAIFAIAFAPNGIGLASASRDNTVQFWNVPDGLPLGTISTATTSLAWSPDGHAIATGLADNSINIWDVAHNSALVTLVGHSGTVAAVAFSPDGHQLASASWDKTVRVWDVSSGRPLHTFSGHTDRVLALAYSPDGQTLASAGADQTIRIWDLAHDTLLRTLRGHTGPINSIAFSEDEHTLASASDDFTVKLWNLATDQPPRTLQGHTAAVLSVSFSPEGRTLASGSADTTVRLWDISTGRALRTLKGHSGPVLCVAYSPLGSTVASGSADKTIRLWEVANIQY